MLIIDPNRNGCTVWYYDKVQYIKGSPQECMHRIIIFANTEGVDLRKRNYTDCDYRPNFIGIDVGGEYGRYWKIMLDEMRVWYDEIKGCKFL